MNRRRAAFIAVVLTTVAACSSKGDSKKPSDSSAPPTVKVTATPSPSPTESAAVVAARQVYLKYTRVSDQTERSPKQANFAQLETLAIDRALGDIEKEILAFQSGNLAFRGTAPQRRVSVVADKSTNQTRPTVQLRDCPTVSPSWKPYNVRSGKPAPTVAAKVAPPYPTAVTVVRLKGRWLVAVADTDRTRTCAP